MKSLSGVLLAALLAAPALALAQTTLVIPPVPQPRIATETQARAALARQGVHDLQHLGQVGDYWEGEGRAAGKPVVAYAFANGAVEIRPASSAQLQQAFGATPQPAG